jgi:hypothetical protein
MWEIYISRESTVLEKEISEEGKKRIFHWLRGATSRRPTLL